MFHNFCSSLARSRYISFFFAFLSILLCGLPGQQSSQFDKFSFFFLFLFFFFFFLFFLLSLGLDEIRRSVCITKFRRSFHVSLPNRFWVVHIPFVRMIWFQFLAQFPVNHLPLPVESCLIPPFAQIIRIFPTVYTGVLYWSLSDSKSPRVSRTVLDFTGRSQKCCSLDGLNSSRFSFLKTHSLGICSNHTNYNGFYHPP